jgi:hypothetical protein
MILMGLDDKPITGLKQQMLYIYNSYKATRPAQSNLFGGIQHSYRFDLLNNANNLDAQMAAIKNSLTTIYSRYGFDNDLEVTVTFNIEANGFIVEVVGTKDGVYEKLSNTLILENK